jgi:hypothetical protein
MVIRCRGLGVGLPPFSQHLGDGQAAALADTPLVELVVAAADARGAHYGAEGLDVAVEAGVVVQLLARQVGQDFADRPARAPGRPFPPGLAEPGEEMVKPRRFHIKNVIQNLQ